MTRNPFAHLLYHSVKTKLPFFGIPSQTPSNVEEISGVLDSFLLYCNPEKLFYVSLIVKAEGSWWNITIGTVGINFTVSQLYDMKFHLKYHQFVQLQKLKLSNVTQIDNDLSETRDFVINKIVKPHQEVCYCFMILHEE